MMLIVQFEYIKLLRLNSNDFFILQILDKSNFHYILSVNILSLIVSLYIPSFFWGGGGVLISNPSFPTSIYKVTWQQNVVLYIHFAFPFDTGYGRFSGFMTEHVA